MVLGCGVNSREIRGASAQRGHAAGATGKRGRNDPRVQ